ncbi:MAG: hypothetical protein OEM79_03625 [Nitrosopumilus sp.]|nr:hypothetical protein [Nitrosopumilus sp.]
MIILIPIRREKHRKTVDMNWSEIVKLRSRLSNSNHFVLWGMEWKNQLTKTPYLVLFIFLITIGGGTAYALITITLAGDVIVEGDMTFTNGEITCTDCIDTADILDGTITKEDLPKFLILETIETVDTTTDFNLYSSIALAKDDIPVVSYFDDVNEDLKFVRCGSTDCSSGNSIQTIDSTGDVGRYTSIALADDDIPVISYQDENNNALKLVRCGNIHCSSGNLIQTVESGVGGTFTSIAITLGDIPVISYYDWILDDLKVVKCGNTDCSSGNSIQTIDSTGDVGEHTSIALATGEIPVISYHDNTNEDLKFVKCGNTDCSSGNSVQTIDSTGNVGWYTSIALAAGDIPVISYTDITNNNLKFVRCGNTDCSSGNSIQTIDSTAALGFYTSVSLAAGNLPVISYFDSNNGNLKIVKCGNTDCSSGNSIQIVDSPGNVGSFSSLALADDDIPVISYLDKTNSALKIQGFSKQKIIDLTD